MLLLVGLLALMGAPAGAVDDPSTALHPLIVFESDRPGNNDTEIYVMNPDGSNQRRLTFDGRNRRPDWSPDGTRIAFSSSRRAGVEIYVMNADGTNQVKLTEGPGADKDPAWSPDGSTIAFVSEAAGNEDIWLMNADGTNLRRLTTWTGFDRDPEWSTDGRFILFSSKRGLRKPDIYIMNADGTNQRRWTGTELSDHNAGWHPTLPRVVYHSHEGAPHAAHLWVADVNESGEIVTTRQLTVGPKHNGDERPSWATDGSKIVFNSKRTYNDIEIWTINPDGSGLKQLTFNTSFDCCAKYR